MEDWSDQRLMQLAIDQAQAAANLDEVPIGCVIVHQPSRKIIGSAFNRRMIDSDPTAHAEILAIRQAAAALHDWRLINCLLAVTLEPCAMCAGAIVNARIPILVYGCDDPKAGAVRTLYRLCEDQRLNHRVEVRGGVMGDRCGQLLQDFFEGKRAMGKK